MIELLVEHHRLLDYGQVQTLAFFDFKIVQPLLLKVVVVYLGLSL